jgi:putative membrane protein
MRIALLIAASLLATACNQSAADGNQTTDTDDMAQNDAAGAFAGDALPALGFAEAAAMSDMYEVTAGNIALERGESEAVREFAQMMVADHTKSSQQLEQALGGSVEDFSMPASLDTEHQAKVDILQSLQGEAFDREYLTQQMTGHRKTLEMLKSYGASGDVADLRQFAQSTIPVVQKHIDWLENNSPMPGGTATGATPAQ